MSYFQLTRNWWDFCFENPEKIKPCHSALYLFIVESCNRQGWRPKFGLPSESTKTSIGIRSYKTYMSTLKDLIDWGFIIMIEESKNQYSANLISLGSPSLNIENCMDKAICLMIDEEEEVETEEVMEVVQEAPEEPENRFAKIPKSGSLKSKFDDWCERENLACVPSNYQDQVSIIRQLRERKKEGESDLQVWERWERYWRGRDGFYRKSNFQNLGSISRNFDALMVDPGISTAQKDRYTKIESAL